MTNQPPQDPSIYLACSHALSSRNFFIWRLVVSIYFWFVEISAQIQYTFETNKHFTLWTLFLCTLYMSVSCYCTYLHYQYSSDDYHAKCIKYCKYAQKLQILSCALSVTVVIAFWALFWDTANYSDPFNPQIHGSTMIFTIIDFFLCYSIISFKSTWWYFLIFGIVYTLWGVIWIFVTNKPVYPVLDWKNAPIMSMITSIMVIVLSISMHAVLCWVNNKFISKKLTLDNYVSDNTKISIILASNISTDIENTSEITKEEMHSIDSAPNSDKDESEINLS